MEGHRGHDDADSSGAVVTALMPLKDWHDGLLLDAVTSVREQTCSRWRLVMIVERTDLARIDRWLGDHALDPRITVVVNGGRKLAGALNTGMRVATTTFVAILLGDDMWARDAVAVLSRYITAHPNADFFHSARSIVDEAGRPISSVHAPRPQVRLEDFQTHAPVKHLLCWRRELALSFGGMDETLNSVGPDDFDFPWTMAEHGAEFVSVREPLYLYRDHREGTRLTTHLPRTTHVRELNRILRKHGLPRSERRARIEWAKSTYLRQCLYRSALDRWWKERVSGVDPREGWRDQYR